MYDTAAAESVRPARAAAAPSAPVRRPAIPTGRHELEETSRRVLRRACDCGARCGGCGDERELRRAGGATPAAMTGEAAPPSVMRVLAQPGRSLDPPVRGAMESRLGHDLARVRVHDDPGAAASAASVGALAYTVGDRVVFGAGRYGPGTPDGERLLVHELAHVVQQRGAPSSGPVVVGAPDSAAEHEAERAAAGPGSHATAASSGRVLSRACGTAVPASTACVPVGGDVAGDLFRFRVNCDDFASGEEARLRAYPTAITPGDTVEVHGYASVEGPVAFNERLSCARALHAQAVLTAALTASGVAATVRPFMHGPTPGPAAERRSVVVTRSTPAPAVSCTGRSLLSRGACGSGTDFTHFDFPALTGADELRVRAMRSRSDADLRDIMENTIPTGLTLLAGAPGSAATAHFMGGTGTTVTHGPASALGGVAAVSRHFTAAVTAARTAVEAELRRMAVSGGIDCTGLSIPAASIPPISFRFPDPRALGADLPISAVMGGTQCLAISLTSFTVDPTARTYDIGLRFEIGDDFGVDAADLYSDSLTAFWILQHERAGHRPFVNMLDLPARISGSF